MRRFEAGIRIQIVVVFAVSAVGSLVAMASLLLSNWGDRHDGFQHKRRTLSVVDGGSTCSIGSASVDVVAISGVNLWERGIFVVCGWCSEEKHFEKAQRTSAARFCLEGEVKTNCTRMYRGCPEASSNDLAWPGHCGRTRDYVDGRVLLGTLSLQPRHEGKVLNLASEVFIVFAHTMQWVIRMPDDTAFMCMEQLKECGDTEQIFVNAVQTRTSHYVTGCFG